MLSQFSIDGSSAIVTGASSGIGQAIAERYAADGVNVAVCSREQGNVDPVAEGINESGREGRAIAVECDVRDREAVDRLVEETVEEFGGLDVLVNNAAGDFRAPFEELSENGWKTIIDINVHGVFHCTQAAGEHLREDGGYVLNLSSVAGMPGGAPGSSHYGASKAAVINLTESLAVEWSDDDVRINCIAPGLVATEGVRTQLGVDISDIPERGPVDRWIGTPQEIADIAQFLASPAASYITGETIVARGVPGAGQDEE